jgi:hypothetical protein
MPPLPPVKKVKKVILKPQRFPRGAAPATVSPAAPGTPPAASSSAATTAAPAISPPTTGTPPSVPPAGEVEQMRKWAEEQLTAPGGAPSPTKPPPRPAAKPPRKRSTKAPESSAIGLPKSFPTAPPVSALLPRAQLSHPHGEQLLAKIHQLIRDYPNRWFNVHKGALRECGFNVEVLGGTFLEHHRAKFNSALDDTQWVDFQVKSLLIVGPVIPWDAERLLRLVSHYLGFRLLFHTLSDCRHLLQRDAAPEKAERSGE